MLQPTCHCLSDIGTDAVLMDKLHPDRCNKACPGNDKQKCGGTNAVTVLVAKCEDGWTRFGGKCFKQIKKE